MKGSPRVVVVGGGIAGLTVAWELARHGAVVTLVRSSRPRTSAVAAGMLAPMPEAVGAHGMLRLGVEGLRHYPDFLAALAEESRQDVGFVRSGLLRLAFSEADVEALRAGVGSYEAAGLPSQWMSPRTLEGVAPGIPGSVLGGLLSFDEAQVQPAWLLAALEGALSRHGVTTREGMVTALPPGPDGGEVGLDGAARLAADRVVLASGAWAAELGGVAVPVRPVKGQLLRFNGVEGPAPIIYAGHNYLLTKADGSVVLGGTVQEAGFSLGADEAAEDLRGLLPRMWPALAGTPAETLVGLRPATPDGLPICGPLPGMPAVYAFTGHFRNGFLLAPHGARLAALEVLEGRPQPLFTPLRPGRFREGALG